MREMGGHGSKMFMVLLMVLLMHSGGGGGGRACGGAASEAENFREKFERVNKEGPYIGILVPTNLEMNPLLQSPSFKLDEDLPYFDFAGRRLHMGSLESKRVLIVLTGSRMLNADLTTKILLVLILLKGVIQCGVARNANSAFQVGDVTIPLYWAHTGLFNWQRYGDESVSLSISHLHNETSWTRNDILFDELLKDDAWYQPEELFPRNGTPEARNASWVRVSDDYFTLAKKLEDMELEGCVNYTTCLPSTSVVRRVQRGISVNKSVNNTAYRHFLSSKFNVTPIDMESAAVAQICREQNTPFIAIVALFDLATNGNSTMLNESNIFASLAARNAAAGLRDIVPYMRDILKGLREIRKSSPLAIEMLKVLSKGNESSAEQWNHKELVQVDCSKNGEVLSIICFKDKKFSGNADGTIKVWSGRGSILHLIQEIQEHAKAVNSLAIFHSGEKLYSGSLDKTARGAGVKVHSWNGGSKLMNGNKNLKCIALVHSKLYCGCGDSSIQEIDLAIGTTSTIQHGSRKLLAKSNPIYAIQVYDGLVYSASSPLDGAPVKAWGLN